MSQVPSTSASYRVLVVEDNPDTRYSLRLLLQAWGHQVEEAVDGHEGIHKAIAWQPDVVVMDIGLPILNGYELARRLKAINAHVLLIALTAYGQPEDRQLAFEAGFAHHLTKPADPEELHQLLVEYSSSTT